MASEKRETALHLGRETNLPPPPPPSSLSNPPPPMAAPTYAPNPHPHPHSQPPPVPLPASDYWTVTPVHPYPSRTPLGAVHQGSFVPPPKKKSLVEAYVLCLPLGFLGAHHFYLGRPTFGVLYFFSFGLLGVGWLVDLLRMPCLVSQVNRSNREKQEQLQQLQQQIAQQQQLSQQHPQQPLPNVVFVPFEPRSLADAYILWFPFGLLGFHHFYLRNYGMGFLYLFTFGLLGIGWLVDLCRMPGLVREANDTSPQTSVRTANQCTAHILALSPAGILGGHHYYLDRPIWGILYTFTLGLCGTGWFLDWFRTHQLVKRANSMRLGLISPCHRFVDDAYVLCLPWGFTGLHHFYLRRYGWGFLYLFTFGILGIGWLVDWFRLPCLVKDCNASADVSCRRLIAGNGNGNGSRYNQAFSGDGRGSGGGSGGRSYGNAGPVTVVISPTQPSVPRTDGVMTQRYPGYPPQAAGYSGYQGYPPQGYHGGSYPSYMSGGAYPPQPPQYTPQPASDPERLHVHVSPGAAPPPYEAASAPNIKTTTPRE